MLFHLLSEVCTASGTPQLQQLWLFGRLLHVLTRRITFMRSSECAS